MPARSEAQHPLLDNPAGGRGGLIAGVWRSARLDEQYMRLILGDRAVLYSFGNYKYLARAQPHFAVS